MENSLHKALKPLRYKVSRPYYIISEETQLEENLLEENSFL